jgi:ornithine carbamoyltransferase
MAKKRTAKSRSRAGRSARLADLRGRDFLSIDDFTKETIEGIFRLASAMKKSPRSFRSRLDGRIMALIFEKPSLRTRTTFDVGIKQLGGDSIYLSPAEINLGKRESVYDVAKNLERMVQGIMIRTFGHDILLGLAKHASIPVINGLTDFEHPCQAMADFLTILEHGKDLRKAKLSYIGDGNNVAHSLMLLAGKLGAHMVVATPEAHRPDAGLVARAQELAGKSGGSIVLTADAVEAARDADMIYTDTWASMGQEGEAEVRRRIFRPYQVNARPARRHLHALSPRASRGRGHRRSDRFRELRRF